MKQNNKKKRQRKVKKISRKATTTTKKIFHAREFFPLPTSTSKPLFPPKHVGLVLPKRSLSDGAMDKDEIIVDLFERGGDDRISSDAIRTPAHARIGIGRSGKQDEHSIRLK